MSLARQGTNPRTSFERIRADLSVQLRKRRSEIESAVLTRAFAVSDVGDQPDLLKLSPDYLDGLRAAISVAVDFGLEVIENGEERAPAPPPLLLAQARLAARSGIGLDMVLRRYSAGYVLLSDFLAEEAECSGLGADILRRLLRVQAVLDRLLAAVSREYSCEINERSISSERRRSERIERLLVGEPLDTSQFSYNFKGSHLGLIASGLKIKELLRSLASGLEVSLLAIERDKGIVWAWLGSQQASAFKKLQHLLEVQWPSSAVLAIGEPCDGLVGWRVTHRQARAALPIALHAGKQIIRYSDVALLTAVLQDELLAASLRRLYIEPLRRGRNKGKVALDTLRAYFAANRNITSTAVTLGVTRRTVANRLSAIESRLGASLQSNPAQVEVSVLLDDILYRTSD
jgi:hypothetical protein